jgi:hypothetical protein
VKYKNFFIGVIGVIAVLFILSGCASSLISRYDPETHQNLAYLKPDIEGIYAMYQTNNIDTRCLATMNQRFKYILAYEKSKGDPNSPTVKQIEIIQKMFKRHADERISQEKWTKEHADIKLKNILTAIDIVIETELLKNK